MPTLTDDEATLHTLDFQPVAGRIGAIVQRVDLSEPISPRLAQAIWTGLTRYKVLFFPQANLDDEGHERFARAFGLPVPHPTVASRNPSTRLLELDSSYGSKTNSWHSDVTFVPAYPSASILRALTVPLHGGDTLWANTATAYDDLPSALRALADQLWTVHTNLFDYAIAPPLTSEDNDHYARIASTPYQTKHPLVRVHPETGERALVLGHFTQKFLDVSPAESVRLFQTFQDHITRPENTVRWRWTEGDVAMWDNRATQHYAIADYGDTRRVMRRITLEGDLPVSVDGHSSHAWSLAGS